MTKYFSVDISNDIHIINLYETLEQARGACLAGAVEAHEFADDMDEYENYESNDLPYAVYGVVLGKAECKKKTLTEEEKDERCSDFDYVLEKPEIVDYPKDDGWIKCSDRLPDVMPNIEVEDSYPNLLLCCKCENGGLAIELGWYSDLMEDGYPKFFTTWKNNEHTSYDFITDNPEVTHWQPLPPPPTE